jgi:Rod binding domain-containing protein
MKMVDPVFGVAAGTPASPKPPLAPAEEARARKTARDFEAAFIAEMLAHAGFAKSLAGDSGFGGESFSRFLLDAYADKLADKGGFGVADAVYQSIREKRS